MFLKVSPNPHAGGRLTRTLQFEASPGQTYAIDAERLYREPHLLNYLEAKNKLRIRALDVAAYAILVFGVLGAFFLAWWLWVPGVALCALMLSVNRKSAGEIARTAALSSNSSFLYLHTIGALWLVRA
ncbi:MAG: hypothetical protein AAFX03_02755 [Pseudomonadota bacterium]